MKEDKQVKEEQQTMCLKVMFMVIIIVIKIET